MRSKQVEKVRVVIDTNVVISALLSKDGNPAKIFELILSENIINFTSNEIQKEIIDVFSRDKIKSMSSQEKIDFVINNYNKLSRSTKPIERVNIVKNDSEDNKFIECALVAKADFIISGDTHLKDIKRFRNMKIFSPKDFLILYSKNSV